MMQHVPIVEMVVPPIRRGRPRTVNIVPTITSITPRQAVPANNVTQLHDPMGVQSAPQPAQRPKQRYALRSEITKVVKAIKAIGIPITTIELRPDGTISLKGGASESPENETEFDRWNRGGQL